MAHGGGQVPVFCSLCEENTEIKWKCLNCDMLMCDKCKEKIHVKFKFAKDHKVVSIEEVGLHKDEIDFSNISCNKHPVQSCVMFCKSCIYLVCPLCISETHNGHGLVTIREGYEILIGKLKTRGMIMGTNINELEKRKEEVKDVDRTELSNFENTMKKIKDQSVRLKKEVDQYTKKLETELIKKWKDVHRCTETEKKEVSLLIESLASKKSEVDDIIQSTDGKRVFEDGLRLVQTIEEKITPPGTKFDSIPTFLPGQITPYNIGSLENISTKGDIKIIKQFETEISDVHFMAACSENTLWITDCEILQKVKIEGRSLQIIDKKNIKIYGMALTPSKDLLLMAGGSVLKQISGQTGKMTDSKYEVKGLERCSAVHVNSDGKVIVGAWSGDLVYPAVGRRVVVVMDKSGRHETTYEYDRQGNPIFTYVRNITRTKNGNICVVDKLSEDRRGRVVILSEDGDVLNTFSGHPKINSDKKPFKPMRAFTTPSDNIIVSNLTHNIYFLNNSGNYIGYCDTSIKGIIIPSSFCSTEAGHTYLGCVTPVDSSDKGEQFICKALQRALSRDSQKTSHPIQVPVHNPDDINEIFDTISYDKGASVIRMLREFLGKEKFMDGITSYLQQYKYGNAVTVDLWSALSKKSGNTVDVKAVMDTWTLQMGYPVVSVKQSGNKFILTQERFLSDGSATTKSDESPFGYKWHIPFRYTVLYKDGSTSTGMVWLHKGSAEISVTKDVTVIKGNYGMYGFYRVNYEEVMWNTIIQQLQTNHTVFSPGDRSGLIDDVFNLARAGLVKHTTALDMTKYLKKEEDYAPWYSALGGLGFIRKMLQKSPAYEQFKTYTLNLVKPIQTSLTWNDSGEPLQKYLRSNLLSEVIMLGDSDATKKGRQLYDDWMIKNTSIPPNLKTAVYTAGIKYGEWSEWKYMLKKYNTSITPSNKDRYLSTLGETRDSIVINRLLHMALNEDMIKHQDLYKVMRAVTKNPSGQLLAWRFVQQNWEKLLQWYGDVSFTLPEFVKSTTSSFSTEFDYKEVEEFFKKVDSGPAKRAVSTALENIRTNINWLKSHEDEVKTWLQKNV